MISLKNAKIIGEKLKINFKIIPIREWRDAMQVEMEHGNRYKLTNVTNDDLLKTGKIALAHILEIPDYYVRLKKMETKGDIYWKNKEKPNILIK